MKHLPLICAMALMTLSPAMANERSDAIRLINKARTAQGLPRLSTSTKLNKVALLHAQELESRGYGLKSRFNSHRSLDGSNMTQRMAKVGVKSCVSVENLAWGQKSAQEVVNDWLVSKDHLKNIMYPKINRIGLARHNRTWVMVASKACKRRLRNLFGG